MRELILAGEPNEKQKLFFASKKKYTAYGGSRGGGKSWALRRKLILLCFRYPGIRCLIIRRSYPELRYNHIMPLRAELGGCVKYSETEKCFRFPNGSLLKPGYMNDDGDTLQYQGQEYDIIALDEATQLTEYQFSTLKACLRGTNGFPKRMYLTCNPGGVGHAWVKRLFIDRRYLQGEDGDEYGFIQASAYDNKALLEKDGEYIKQLESLPEGLRRAWLYGQWDVFEGQFFPSLGETHLCEPFTPPKHWRMFGGLDYGFDMLAFIVGTADSDGNLYIIHEYYRSGLTLSEAAEEISRRCSVYACEYIAASPDLWNRRQDTGRSGFEIMASFDGIAPLIRADDRRVPGWRVLREYIHGGSGKLYISRACPELYRCLSLLTYDKTRTEDCSSEPHSITHLPEALRYLVMSRPEKARTERERYEARRKRAENRSSIIYY